MLNFLSSSSTSLVNQIKKNLGIQLSTDPCHKIESMNNLISESHSRLLPLFFSLENLIKMHSYKQIKN